MSAKRKRAKPPTRDELAQAMGVNVRTLNGWVAKGCPTTSVEAVRAWKSEHVRPRPDAAKQGDEQQNSLQRRRMLAEAEKAEEAARAAKLRNDKAAGLLHENTVCVREAAEIFSAARAMLDAVPDAIAKECPDQVRTRVYETAKTKLAGVLKKLAELHLLGTTGRSAPDGA